jgi:hypothetical protein
MKFTPVQMIGTQRSGSNLLRLMLNQLDGVSAPHPPHILERFFPLLPAYKDLTNPFNFTQLVNDVCKLIEFNPVPWTGLKLVAPAIIARCKRPLLTEIFRVIYEMRAERENSRIWICKSLVNIRFADQLEEYGVKPLYIHLFRDGRDVALSFKKAIVGEKHMYHIASQWKEEQEASLLLADKLGSVRVLKVCYEELLADPEKELLKICRFIGAEYNSIALDYFHSEESHKTASSGVMWQNVKKPIISDNFNKFKKELIPQDILLFEQVAGDTLEKLGYSRSFPNNGQHVFSSEDIKLFSELNKKLKQEARLQLKPEDLEKRKNQEELIQGIKTRYYLITGLHH